MGKRLLWFLAFLATLSARGLAGSDRVENFVLLDHEGRSHELYELRDARAIVLLVHGNGCPMVRRALSDLRILRESYSGRGVHFLMIDSNRHDDRASIAQEARDLGIDFPVLVDETQLIGESLDLVCTAEVLLIDPGRWQLKYRGPIDDRRSAERPGAIEHYLSEALDALFAGEPIEVERREAFGSLIHFPWRDEGATIRYADTIAPLLEQNCVGCHRDGGIGPWAMTSYESLRGFTPMIREVLRTRRMPPWVADPHVGEFKHDRSLSVEDRRTLVHWIESGAPRGDGPDPLRDRPREWPSWPLGEPDLIVTLPSFEVPATGVVDYQFPALDNPLDRDVWVRAATIEPGDRSVVHHVLAGTLQRSREAGAAGSLVETYLMGYAPGAESVVYPEGTGVFVPRGGCFLFQMHYAPTGIATTDVTRLALYFHEERPPHIIRNHVILDPTLRIPPHATAHEERAYFEFEHDALLYSLNPHAHYRGRSSTFSLVHPGGRTETLLSVPRYDFDWQCDYAFVEPVVVPAGSRLVHATVYDNSERNPANPDPDQTVQWGLQSEQEMLYGTITYRWTDERSNAPFHDARRAKLRQRFGYQDRNLSGRIEPAEVPAGAHQGPGDFARADRNGDGALDFDEYSAVVHIR